MYHMYSREPHLVVAVKLFQQTLISSFGEPTLLIQQVQDTQFLRGGGGGRMKKFKGLRQRGRERDTWREEGRKGSREGGRNREEAEKDGERKEREGIRETESGREGGK